MYTIAAVPPEVLRDSVLSIIVDASEIEAPAVPGVPAVPEAPHRGTGAPEKGRFKFDIKTLNFV